jgi:F0F1-type ATP synthase assembly protein I
VDRWQETAPWFAVAGLLLGVIVGLYEIAKIVWPR